MLYVLKLQHGKYYVGRTVRTSLQRVMDHIRGRGSNWTKLHPPLGLNADCVSVHDGDTDYDETLLTLRMMREHGWQNVRGGKFTRIAYKKMPAAVRAFLARGEVIVRKPEDDTMPVCLCGFGRHEPASCLHPVCRDGDVIMRDAE